MKIMTILGSPRRHGNTAGVLAAFEALAERAHQVERVNIIDYHIGGCLGCDSCQGRGKGLHERPECAQKDDAALVFEKLLASDLVVYASPVYCWSVSAQMKALFDRLYCMVCWNGDEKRAFLEGRPAMLLATCGDIAAENADLLQEQFRREMEYLRCPVAGQFVLDRATDPKTDRERAQAVAGAMFTGVETLKVGVGRDVLRCGCN